VLELGVAAFHATLTVMIRLQISFSRPSGCSP
jgi:hypothetical protein